jgi:hypothetical protein
MAITWAHLTTVSRALGVDCCYLVDGRFHFALDDRLCSVSVSHEIGGRLRVDTYTGCTRTSTTGWVFGSDHNRLARLARTAASELELEVGPVA